MAFADELRRRNVFRVAAAYLVVGWLLTEVLTTILPELGAPSWAARTVILLFALGFLPTVVLSWVYEITPEGVKREADLDTGEKVRGSHRRFDYIVIATVFALVVALAVLGARTSVDDTAAPPGAFSDASVAVLPFVNMSSDADNEYFSDGLTETLLHLLAQVPELKVAARTSSFSFKGQNKTIDEIARSLKVAHVLEGSVQKAGNRVRITAQLIRAEDGFHVWSESFDREYDDIFRIQDEIAERVGDALTASLLGTQPTTAVAGVGTDNADAYDLYLQALGLGSTLSYGGLQASENMLKAALATDPGYLDAKVQLAMNYLKQRETGLLDDEQAVERIDDLTAEVLAERPADPLAHALSLFAGVIRDGQAMSPDEFFDTVQRFEALVADNPGDDQISIMLADLLTGLQRYDRALEVLQAALEADEFNPRLHFELGMLYSQVGRLDDAREATARSLELEPRQPSAYVLLSRLARLDGDAVEVVRQLLNALTEDPRDNELPGEIAAFLYNLGLFEAGDDFRNMVIASAPDGEYAHLLDILRAVRSGDLDIAEAAARRAIEDDIEMRRGGFAVAVRFLMRHAVASGAAETTIAFLENEAPGLFDIDADAVTAKYRQAQIVSMESFYAVLPPDEFAERLDLLLGKANDFGLDPLADAQSRLAVQLMRGDLPGAIETALNDVLSKSVMSDLDWQRTYAQPLYRELVADERVQAAMSRWEAELDAMRASVRSYLADLSTGGG